MELNLRTYPDPILTTACRKAYTPLEEGLVDEMRRIMEENDGVGIAAPQVGINARVCLVKTEDEVLVLINPVVMRWSGQAIAEEGCLSLPGRMVPVRRAVNATIRYFDEDGRIQTLYTTGETTRICLHELDHLNGKLIIDRDVRK